MEPVPYTFVSINRRKNEAGAHIATWTLLLPFIKTVDKTQPYT